MAMPRKPKKVVEYDLVEKAYNAFHKGRTVPPFPQTPLTEQMRWLNALKAAFPGQLIYEYEQMKTIVQGRRDMAARRKKEAVLREATRARTQKFMEENLSLLKAREQAK